MSALAPRPVTLDEPSLGPALRFVKLVFDTIREVNAAAMTLPLVEQDAVKSPSMSDREYVLDLGRNGSSGSGAALLADERVRRLYLGGRLCRVSDERADIAH